MFDVQASFTSAYFCYSHKRVVCIIYVNFPTLSLCHALHVVRLVYALQIGIKITVP